MLAKSITQQQETTFPLASSTVPAHNPKQKHHNVIEFNKCYVKLFKSPRRGACISLLLTVIRLMDDSLKSLNDLKGRN